MSPLTIPIFPTENDVSNLGFICRLLNKTWSKLSWLCVQLWGCGLNYDIAIVNGRIILPSGNLT